MFALIQIAQTQSFFLAGEPKAKAKAKAKAKGKGTKTKKDAEGNPIAVWELKKMKASNLSAPFPIVHRGETKKLAEKEIIAKAGETCILLTVGSCAPAYAKAGAYARIAVKIADYAAAKDAMDELTAAKNALEQCWTAWPMLLCLHVLVNATLQPGNESRF